MGCFCPQEVVEEEQGAVGGQGHNLRQGVAALMDTMRDLLNNIQPVPPPREDGPNEGDADEGGQDQDNLEEFDWIEPNKYTHYLLSMQAIALLFNKCVLFLFAVLEYFFVCWEKCFQMVLFLDFIWDKYASIKHYIYVWDLQMNIIIYVYSYTHKKNHLSMWPGLNETFGQ